jgi:hypothetical protein
MHHTVLSFPDLPCIRVQRVFAAEEAARNATAATNATEDGKNATADGTADGSNKSANSTAAKPKPKMKTIQVPKEVCCPCI